MAKKLPCLSRMGICHDGQEVPMSIEYRTLSHGKEVPTSFEDGTLSRWSRCTHVFRGWDCVTMIKMFPCLSRI